MGMSHHEKKGAPADKKSGTATKGTKSATSKKK
jgi:hypothetical protein